MSNEIIIRDVGFTLPNATGNFTITDTGGPGQTPKACIIVLSGATGAGSETNPARISIGMTDGTDAIAIGMMAEHGVVAANADTGRRRANDKILNIPGTASEALGVGATFTSVGTNALTINLDTASTLRGWVRFFYGAEFAAKVGTVASNLLVDNAVLSPSLGLQPDGVICISARTQWNVDAGLANAIFSMGFAGRLPSITQACMNVVAGDRINPTSVGQKPRDNRVLSIAISTAGVITEAVAIEVTAFNADDIEFTTRELGEVIGIGYLAFSLNGEKCHTACPALNSDSTGISAYTTPGFRARALMVLGQAAATVNTLDSTTGAMSLGVYSPLTAGGGGFMAKWNSADNQSTSITTTAYAEDQVVHVESKWAARVTQITSIGFEYNVLVSASADLPTVVFSIGEASEVSTDTEEISDQTVFGFGLSPSDTEEISDQTAFSVGLPLSETEEISDQTAFAATFPLSETEQIVDEVVLVSLAAQALAVFETEEIADEIVLFTSGVTNVDLVLFDVEEILGAVGLVGSALIVLSDTEAISDEDLVFLGRILTLTDTEEISDQSPTALTITASKGAYRGTTLQGGAEAGWTYQAGAERGGSFSG